MFHLIVCGDGAGKTRTAIQEELVEMMGICHLHVRSGTNPNLSRSLHDFLGSSPGNLPISPKIEKGRVEPPALHEGTLIFVAKIQDIIREVKQNDTINSGSERL